MDIKNETTSTEHYAPFVRAVELYKLIFQKRLSDYENHQNIREIERMSESDSHHINNSGVVDIDKFLSFLIQKYGFLIGKVRDYVQDIFKAADV